MTNKIYGYVRAFKQDQNAILQKEAMRKAGITRENVYIDKPGEKIIFHELQAKLLPGDEIVIKSFNQLGYNYYEMYDAWITVTRQLKSHIRVLDLALVNTRAGVKQMNGTFVLDLVSQMLSYAAEQERIYIRRRQAEGIAYAKELGKHLGRPRILKPDNFDEIYALWRGKHISAIEAMKQLNLKRSTFERFVKERKEQKFK